jgi:hypothetical protein
VIHVTHIALNVLEVESKKVLLATRYIKHLADSANFMGVTFNENCSGLTGNRFEMSNVSYTQTLVVSRNIVA